MKKQKGFTLLEVLGSVTILAIAILSITYLFQQTTLFSIGNEKADKSVLITRTVMEEIKNSLRTSTATITVNNQTINLQLLRSSSPPFSLPTNIFYPSVTDQQFKMVITSKLITSEEYRINDVVYNLSSYFRLIHITCTNLSNNRTFELESYVEYI